MTSLSSLSPYNSYTLTPLKSLLNFSLDTKCAASPHLFFIFSWGFFWKRDFLFFATTGVNFLLFSFLIRHLQYLPKQHPFVCLLCTVVWLIPRDHLVIVQFKPSPPMRAWLFLSTRIFSQNTSVSAPRPHFCCGFYRRKFSKALPQYLKGFGRGKYYFCIFYTCLQTWFLFLKK